MAEVRIARFGTDLGAFHAERRIPFLGYAAWRYRFGEGWPARAAVEFVHRTKQRFTGDDTDINSRPVIVTVGVVEWRLRGGFARAITTIAPSNPNLSVLRDSSAYIKRVLFIARIAVVSISSDSSWRSHFRPSLRY